MTLTDVQRGTWTAKDLSLLSVRELREIVAELDPYADSMHATKAEMVAHIIGEWNSYEQRHPTPESMMREMRQLESWVRVVPPPEACLKADDKIWIKQMMAAVL